MKKPDRRFKGPAWEVRQEKIQQAIIDFYKPSFFEGKTVYSFGCAYGAIELKLLEYGANLVLTEARQEYLDYIDYYFKHDRLKTQRVDLDNEFPIEGVVDMIICVGILYHLARPDKILEKLCRHCNHLFLETEYLDTNRDHMMLCYVEAMESSENHNINRIGCRPSHGMVNRILWESGKEFIPITNDIYNSEFHVYNDGVRETFQISPKNFRGMWAC